MKIYTFIAVILSAGIMRANGRVDIIKPPERQLGEDCGFCLCPPTYTMGECGPGLECEHDSLDQDAPGKCVESEDGLPGNS